MITFDKTDSKETVLQALKNRRMLIMSDAMRRELEKEIARMEAENRVEEKSDGE